MSSPLQSNEAGSILASIFKMGTLRHEVPQLVIDRVGIKTSDPAQVPPFHLPFKLPLQGTQMRIRNIFLILYSDILINRATCDQVRSEGFCSEISTRRLPYLHSSESLLICGIHDFPLSCGFCFGFILDTSVIIILIKCNILSFSLCLYFFFFFC